MNYIKIDTEDVCNGSGLRVCLWLSSCSHHCYNCQNPQIWNPKSGTSFDEEAKKELFRELEKDYISGLTLTGGDPLHENNLDGVLELVKNIKTTFKDKNIWIYSGYEFEDIFSKSNIVLDEFTAKVNNNYEKRKQIISLCDVMVDGKYIDSQRDISLAYRGSKNQRVINIRESLKQNKVVLYCD